MKKNLNLSINFLLLLVMAVYLLFPMEIYHSQAAQPFMSSVFSRRELSDAAGDLDTSFGSGGKVTTSIVTGSDEATAIAIQNDGKIILGGYTSVNSKSFALARYLTSGSLDTSFGSNGLVVTNPTPITDEISDIIIQPDGKIVAAGYAWDGSSSSIVLARYLSNGSLDSSFDADGIKVTNLGGFSGANALAIQSDGKIVVAGFWDNQMIILRYNINGSLDTSFNGSGRVTVSNYMSANDVLIQPHDQKIVAVGMNASDFAIVRLNSNGTLDSSFDGDGKLTTDFGSYDVGYAMAIQSDQKLLACGSSGSGTDTNIVLARYQSNGSLDLSFDSDGKVTTNIAGSDECRSIAIQDNGKIVVGGTAGAQFALARYNSSGSLDQTFSQDGLVRTSIWDYTYGNAIAIQQNDGRILLAGSTWSSASNNGAFALARYIGDTPVYDGIPPATITNLMASTGNETGSIMLSWTAPGDDGNSGTAYSYIVRHSSSAITNEVEWNAAINVPNPPAPLPAGSSQSMLVTGLNPGQRYYFAIKTLDEVANISGLSNTASAIARSGSITSGWLDVTTLEPGPIKPLIVPSVSIQADEDPEPEGVTDSNGNCRIELPEGDYEVWFSKPGYYPSPRDLHIYRSETRFVTPYLFREDCYPASEVCFNEFISIFPVIGWPADASAPLYQLCDAMKKDLAGDSWGAADSMMSAIVDILGIIPVLGDAASGVEGFINCIQTTIYEWIGKYLGPEAQKQFSKYLFIGKWSGPSAPSLIVTVETTERLNNREVQLLEDGTAPFELHLYSDNQHLGLVNGRLERTIPNSYLFTFKGNYQIAMVKNPPDNLTIKVIGRIDGPLYMTIVNPRSSGIGQLVVFDDQNLSQGSITTLNLRRNADDYQLQYDQNGDGEVDRVSYPNTIETIYPVQNYLPLVTNRPFNNQPYNLAPYMPRSPYPENDKLEVSTTPTLTWQGGDPEGDTTLYDVYLEENDLSPDKLICNNIQSNSCQPRTLKQGTDYYWKVVAFDNTGRSTSGALWRFSTKMEISVATTIAPGYWHNCAVTTTGVLKCWGDNDYGDLGDGTTANSNTPIDVVGLSSGVQAVSAAFGHTCALTTTGAVKCWGWNYFGQLGDGTTNDSYTPVDVIGLSSDVVAITSGFGHNCALTTAGAVKCWGMNVSGQLGNDETFNSYTPVDVVGLSTGVQAIAAGGQHTCALTNAGAVKCWGNNWHGELGDGTRIDRSTPVNVVGLSSGVKAIVTGMMHTCALTTAGAVKCWGWNRYGSLGDGTTTDRYTPVDVVGLSEQVQAIGRGAGNYHTCAITTSGTVKCWGFNEDGQLGDGTTTNQYTPVDVVGLSTVIQVVGGYGHTCALTTTGGVKCWGQNASGQLGNGTTINSLYPVDVIGFSP